jgi:amino acid permease
MEVESKSDTKPRPGRERPPPDQLAQLNNKLDAEYKLPVTGDRTAKWWYSAFHNVTAMVGAGVLGLPSAMVFLTWGPGVVMMVLSWVVTLYTLWQLCSMHEIGNKRFNRYHELGQYAFGQRAGLWIVIPFQLIVMIGLGIVYCVTGGQSMHAVYQLTCNQPCAPFGLSAWIVVFAAIQLLLVQGPSFNSLRFISLSAAVMSLSYSTIAIAASIAHGKAEDAAYNLDRFSTAAGVFGVFNSLGTVAFAYGGHNVVLEIQACMPSPPATFKPMMNGVYIAYVIVAWCYFGVAFAGYWAFGNTVASNVLLTQSTKALAPTWVLVMADIFVLIHVTGSYQVYSMPVFDMIETQMVKRGISNGVFARLIYRSLYVVLTAFVAITLPFFGSLLGFLGAFAFGPTTFWLPPLIYLIVVKPKRLGGHWWASWFCIIFGLLITVLGAIGGMQSIIVSASDYEFYQ